MGKQDRSGIIYVIGSAENSLVKIGVTFATVLQRLRQLQISSPVRLSVCVQCVVETDVFRVEKVIHRFLATEREHGEWFRSTINTEELHELVLRAHAYLAHADRQRAKAAAERIPTQRELGRARREAAARACEPPLLAMGDRIRIERAKRKITQYQLAKLAGVAQPTIANLELGKPKGLSAGTLVVIARALEVSIDFLVYGEAST